MPWLIALLLMILAIGLWHRLETQSQQRQQIEHYMATMQLTIAPLMPVKDGVLLKAQLNKLRAISLLPLESISIYSSNKKLLISTGLPSELEGIEPEFDINSVALKQQLGYWFAQLPVVSTRTEPFLPSMSDESYILFAVFQAESVYASWLMPIVIVGFAGLVLLFIIHSNTSQQQQRLQTDVGLITHKLSQIVAGQHNVMMNEELVPELALIKPAINELANYQSQLLQQHKTLEEQLQQDIVQCYEQKTTVTANHAELEQQYTTLAECTQNHVQSFSALLSQRSEMSMDAFQQALAMQVALLRMELNNTGRRHDAIQLAHVIARFIPAALSWLSGKGIELSLVEGPDNVAYEITCCSEQLDILLMALLQLGARANGASELTLSVKLCADNNAPMLQMAITSNGDGISAQLCQRLNGELDLPLQWHEADIGIITNAVKRFNAAMDIQLLDGLGSAIVLNFPLQQLTPVVVGKLQHVLLFEQTQNNQNEHGNSMKLLCEHLIKCSDITELEAKTSLFAYDVAIIVLPEPADLAQWQRVLNQLSIRCTVKCYSNSNNIAVWREALQQNISAGPFCLADLGKPVSRVKTSVPKLLVVDDNQTNLSFVQILMKGQQVELFTAACGQAALDLCRQHRFDAVLLDIQLPDISGIEVARQLRQLPSYQFTPILAFTAHALEDEVEEFKRAGMNDVIFKPLEATKLGQIMRWCSAGKTNDIG